MKSTNTAAAATAALQKIANPQKAITYRGYFKECGDDIFLGVTTPLMRAVAKEFRDLPLPQIRLLMSSRIHDERSLAHAILRLRFEKGSEDEQERIFDFYVKNRKFIRSWDGVDDSAPYIAGRFLLNRDKKLLYDLIVSENIWDRRIALVTTWWFIRNGRIDDTLKLVQLVLKDNEDLIHKAAGWMLREAGKRDAGALKGFLKTHGKSMPRTMLRYAIERFPEAERKTYLRS